MNNHLEKKKFCNLQRIPGSLRPNSLRRGKSMTHSNCSGRLNRKTYFQKIISNGFFADQSVLLDFQKKVDNGNLNTYILER
jgi:hypothetical protein